MASEFSILTPNAMLGYGYRTEHFWYGIEQFSPTAIIVDSGSTDGGPYKLGLNKMTCGRESYVRDLTPILQACFHKKIQVLIGSVGGDGSDKHVREMFEIVQEIAAKESRDDLCWLRQGPADGAHCEQPSWALWSGRGVDCGICREGLESAAFDSKLVISALRSYSEGDVLPQAKAIADFPILLRKLCDGPKGLPQPMQSLNNADKALRGLRVLELSRVIAAPLSGETLAAHGADVLWVTSPNLPDLPTMDRDFGRAKRTIHIDLQNPSGQDDLSLLLDDAHVFIQGFHPGSLAARGLAPSELATRYKHRNIICANMSAYGPDGPWASRRGFDSLIQTCSGMNVSEAEHFGAGEAARPTPCQALDHAGGYFLAAGITAALYKQATEGGSWEVDVSLAGVMKYLRSLGQFEGKTGFATRDYACTADVPPEYLETRMTGFGEMVAARHSASVDSLAVGWDVMPKPLGADERRWL